MKKIITVVGARPQFIKAAALSRCIEKHYSQNFKEVIVHTGQHYDVNMSDIFFEELKIPKPTYRLDVGGQSHAAMTSEMLVGLEAIYIKEKPDFVLVYGDTNSTLAGALVAQKMDIPIAHVEAGMRSFNKKMPEEINRVLTDHMSSILFCPSKTSVEHLKKENIEDNVFDVGDIMYDAVLEHSNAACENIPKEKFVLMTLHRQENTSSPERLNKIFELVNKLAEDYQILFPIHPRTKKELERHEVFCSPKIKVIEPVGYAEMLALVKASELVITDSGGLQKESYYLKRPTYILRSETEWVELLETGAACLEDSDPIEQIKNLLSVSHDFPELYGDGKTSKKILDVLSKF